MKEKCKIGAVMVLYHPEWSGTLDAISNLASQVDMLCVVDNTPDEDNSDKLAEIENVHYIALKENLGIASAQNKAIVKFIDEKYDFIVFSDQDSSAPAGIVDTLHEDFIYIRRHGFPIGAIGSYPVNKNTGRPYAGMRGVSESVKVGDRTFERRIYVISSFSMVSLEMFSKVGLLREDLFMDYVENEWHFRLRSAGYQIFQSKDAIFAHELGQSKSFFGKSISISSPFRLYNQIRNYQWLKHLDYVPDIWKRYVWNHQVKKILYYPLIGPSRLKYIKSIVNGLRDAKSRSLDKIIYPHEN